MESTWDLMTVENQHCQCREKHHKQVCFKNEAGKQFGSGFFRASNAFLGSCQQRLWPSRGQKTQKVVSVALFWPQEHVPPWFRTRRQWWPQKKQLLRGQLKGMDSKGCVVSRFPSGTDEQKQAGRAARAVLRVSDCWEPFSDSPCSCSSGFYDSFGMLLISCCDHSLPRTSSCDATYYSGFGYWGGGGL